MNRVLGVLTAATATAIALVSCHGTDATYTIGGDISGVTTSAVLKLNGGNDIAIGNGSFKFDKKLLTNETFNVQVVDADDRCTIANGAGTVGKSNVTNVSISCVLQDVQNITQAVVRSANLNGAQENPSVTTNAAGVGGVVVVPGPVQMAITGGITFSGLVPLAGQINIHLAPGGNPTGNGPAIVPLILAADGLTAVVPPATTLNSALLGPLLRGEFYFNVATAANPSGEIRGAIELQGGVAASFAALDQSQVVPPTGSSATGVGTILADRATRRILISYITHTVAGANAADLRTSAAGGSRVLAFTNLQTGIDIAGNNLATPPAGSVLTAQNLADFDSNLLYFNVATAARPNGEIRGNISPR